MLSGRFGAISGRPILVARVTFPRLGLSGEVSFLVDTGADSSLIMPANVVRIGISYDLLVGTKEVSGVGGEVSVFSEPALLIFSDDQALYIYDLMIDLLPHRHEALSMPSLLGRDVLDRWKMTYDPRAGDLSFEIFESDATLMIPE